MQTKKCSKCSKNMIRVLTGEIIDDYSIPAMEWQRKSKHPMKWWCKCKNEEEAGYVKGNTKKEILNDLWGQSQTN